MTLDSAIKQLETFFGQDGWPSDLSYNKLCDRASLSSDKDKPGWDVVEIERHRGILGAQYTQGLPMSSFQTYWVRYAINPETEMVEELPEKIGEASIDLWSLINEDLSEGFSLSIEPTESGKYRIHENVSGKKATISSVQEAQNFGLMVVSGWGNYFQEQLDITEMPISQEENKKYVSRYQKYLEEQVVDKIKEAWEERESL